MLKVKAYSIPHRKNGLLLGKSQIPERNNNKRYFYQLDGEGIRYELAAFARAISDKIQNNNYIPQDVSLEICKIMEDYLNGEVVEIE